MMNDSKSLQSINHDQIYISIHIAHTHTHTDRYNNVLDKQ